ncbi:acyltransferase [Nocardioides panacis]|uniref:Acyltransferase n=1 Tax=Nocardioides panacis TaxID=2849501 RepID=A0A975SWV8_9ACTN|nr:acyltransferase [Nocardioides panacis]QWZ07361.1 acyltransferase [Nocardioides panacis]
MRSSGEVWRLRRLPGLDGVRGLAIILVILCHSAVPHLNLAGQAGVTLFFVLSGFLITGILLGGQNLSSFWPRRARRLLPALLVMLALLLPAFVLAGWTVRQYGDAAWPGLLYVANIREMQTGWIFPFGHLWSLSVEEQFYVVWPLVVVALRRRPAAVLAVSLLGVAASVMARWNAEGFHAVLGTDTNAFAMFAGTALAAAFATGWKPPIGRGATWIGAAAVIASALWSPTAPRVDMVATLTTAGAVLMIAGEVAGRGDPLLRFPPLRYVGRVSYGWYLWHIPLITLFSTPGMPGVEVPLKLALCGVALAIAALSFRFIEVPLQGRRPAAAVVPAPVAS